MITLASYQCTIRLTMPQNIQGTNLSGNIIADTMGDVYMHGAIHRAPTSCQHHTLHRIYIKFIVIYHLDSGKIQQTESSSSSGRPKRHPEGTDKLLGDHSPPVNDMQIEPHSSKVRPLRLLCLGIYQASLTVIAAHLMDLQRWRWRQGIDSLVDSQTHFHGNQEPKWGN